MRRSLRPEPFPTADPDDVGKYLDLAPPQEQLAYAHIRQRHRKREMLDPDPKVWLAAHRMTQTEVSLRLARWLLDHHLVATEVSVALTGYELTRRDKPRFPVERYLAERGLRRADPGGEWRGAYSLDAVPFALRLHDDPREGDVVATLATGRRFVAHVSAGLLEPTRSPAEHKLLRGALARALTFEGSLPGDCPAAVVPRSSRFRKLAARWRATDGVRRAGIHILCVDRAGTVEGWPDDAAPRPSSRVARRE